MRVTSEISIVDGRLMVAILTRVPKNVVLTASTGTVAQGAFLGASSSERSNRHVFTLGVLRDLRFMCCFRFNLWWMTQRMGLFGKDVPLETQFLLLESKDGSQLRTGTELDRVNQTLFIVFLPLSDGLFRASLQGNKDGELQLCMESGDAGVAASGGSHSIFVYSGPDPFQVIADAVQAVEMHMQTFQRREDKKMPGILNWFGWCTWDAFYTEVTPEGVKRGLKSLEEGGTPARLIIVDDRWQSVASDDKEEPRGESTAGTHLTHKELGVAFAPIGLLKMFNSGGAVVSVRYQLHANNVVTEFEEKPSYLLDFAIYEIEKGNTVPVVATINMKVRGCGECGVYLSIRPRDCRVDFLRTDFTYNPRSGLVSFMLPHTKKFTQDVVLEV